MHLHTLSALNQALTQVDNTNAFFDMDLKVDSKDHRFKLQKFGSEEFPVERYERARIVIAEIVNTFFNTAKSAKESEISDFQNRFSSYCGMILNDQWSDEFKSFVDSAQYAVKKISKHYLNPSDMHSILLITDVDDKPGGAMAVRASRYLYQNIPAIMPYELLTEMINHSFHSSEYYANYDNEFLQTRQLCMIKKTCQDLSNTEKWSFYTNGSLIAILPKNSTNMLNLNGMKEVLFEDVKQEAILRSVGKPYLHQKINPGDIIEILSSDEDKTVVWGGHGTLEDMQGRPMAMGLTLKQVSTVFNQVKSVRLWDLHSCFLLGNIEKIMRTMQSDSIVKMSGGFIVSTKPPEEGSDMTSTYLFLASKAVQKGKPDKLSRIFPLMDGFVHQNHPHIISSKKIETLTYPGIVDKVSSGKKASRLYIDQQTIREPLHLSGKVALLPGMLSENHFCFSEITTDLTFEDFISSAFGQYCQRTKLIQIEKLNCKDGLFEKVSNFTENYQSKVLFSKNDAWHSLDITWSDSTNIQAGHDKFEIKPFNGNTEDFVQSALECCQPTVDNALEEESKPVLVSNNSLGSKEEGELIQAIVLQDIENISLLLKNMDESFIKKAFQFCIDRNLIEPFFTLLKLMDQNLLSKKAGTIFSLSNFSFRDISLIESLVFHCIKFKNLEILSQLNQERYLDVEKLLSLAQDSKNKEAINIFQQL